MIKRMKNRLEIDGKKLSAILKEGHLTIPDWARILNVTATTMRARFRGATNTISVNELYIICVVTKKNYTDIMKGEEITENYQLSYDKNDFFFLNLSSQSSKEDIIEILINNISLKYNPPKRVFKFLTPI